MQSSIRAAIVALTQGKDAERHFNLAAERIQRALLDVSLPEIANLEIGVKAEPSHLVGGDYIDLYVSSEHSLVLGLGDASGKSLAAALNAMMLRYLVRGLVRALGTTDLISIVRHTNEIVTEDMTEGSFITFLLAALRVDSGALQIVNAGHEPPLMLQAASQTVKTIDGHNIVLGIDSGAQYVEQTEQLDRGDLLLLYTDGLTEATNRQGELYTIERLAETLIAGRSLPAQELANRVFDAVTAYAEGPLPDDATLLVLRKR
jgi:phosphoserine phosphatase RsbU/P